MRGSFASSTAFILYRQAWQGHFAAQHPGLANPEISKLIGEKWREQPESVKNEWKQLAEEEKIRHQRQYPGYRYQPRRGGKNGSGRPTSSSGETPGRCPKCGGRYIATPRTPTTPFSVASSPPLSKRAPSMQPYMSTEHPRHGSISAGSMPVDGHARRYAHAQFRDVEEDYPIMSPLAAPPPGVPHEAKRRRFNGPPVYVPRSPHMGYAPVDPRYQHRPSVGGPPVSATGYDPGHHPRPPMQLRQEVYASHPNHPHMQPPLPPRQSMSYQQAMATTPNRPNGGFDESLRLPPLQSQIYESSALEPGARQAMPPVQGHQAPGTGLGIAANPGSGGGGGAVRQAQQQSHHHPHPHPPHHPGSPMPQIWPFLLKFEELRSVSQPLAPPGAGGPHFETRGPIVAVEGAPTPMRKEVAAVIERALSVSAEFAVRVWSEDTSTAIAHSSPEPHVHAQAHHAQAHAHAEANGDGAGAGGNNADNSNGAKGAADSGAVAAAQKKTPALMSPIASHVARMLKWHKTSEDLVRYITSYPPAPKQSGAGGGDGGSNSGAATTTTTTGTGTPNHGNGPTNSNAATPSHRLPIALISDGYSLTFSDRYAAALHVNDRYRANDHWQWVARLWRGIVGADLTVYVKRTPDETQAQTQSQGGGAGGNSNGNSGGNNNNNNNNNGSVNGTANNSLEIVGPGIMVIRVPEGGHVDEKLERRLGFEVAEWVRGGSYMAGFGKT